MRPARLIALAVLLASFASPAFASTGPLLEITPEERPRFVEVVVTPANYGNTKFEVILRSDAEYTPQAAYLELFDGTRVILRTALVLRHIPKNDAWVTWVDADADLVRRARIIIGYGNNSPVSRTWFIECAKFAKQRPPTTKSSD